MSVRACILTRMDTKIPPSLRRVIAEQAGVASRQQLLRAGVSRTTVDSKHKRGLWQQLHPGVYGTFTGTATREAHLWAAVLYAGPGALLSHETAAELCHLIDDPVRPLHVSVPFGRRVSPPPGVQVHMRRAMPRSQPALSPPRTTVEETVLDLTQTANSVDDAIGWLARACARRLTTPARIARTIAGRRRVRWRRILCAALDDVALGCHSLLELRYLRDVERAHNLPVGLLDRQTEALRPALLARTTLRKIVAIATRFLHISEAEPLSPSRRPSRRPW